MLVKFGSIVTAGSGSLGGHTIQNSKGGMQLRTKPINKKAPSVAQQLIRSYNPKLQAGWRSLTEQQRYVWNVYGINHGVFNKNGERHSLSGHSLWMKYNFVYINLGLPFIVSPYNFVLSPIGNELIVNGTFETDSDWITGVGWSISDFGLHVDIVDRAYTSQFVTALEIGKIYRISIDCTVYSRGTIRVYLGSSVKLIYISETGITIADSEFLGVDKNIYIQPNVGGFKGSFDNVSVKELL